MVKHDIVVRGTDFADTQDLKAPVILQMHDDDFPARFLQDLLTKANPPISSVAAPTVSSLVSGSPPVTVTSPVLFQPVQRMLNVALIKMNCHALDMPRLDPTRVLSAGLVVRRVARRGGHHGSGHWHDLQTHLAWMKNSKGQWNWVKLNPVTENLDPDPKQRPALRSGDAGVDSQLAAMMATTALTESTSPAFVAPPATCTALNRTVLYGMVPTASSEVSDAAPVVPAIDPGDLQSTLPNMLRSAEQGAAPHIPIPGAVVDYRWLNDDLLNAIFPPQPPSGGGQYAVPVVQDAVNDFHQFTLALRMLDSVFGAFDGTAEGNSILAVLNGLNVHFDFAPDQRMGDFYAAAKEALLNVQSYPGPPPSPATVTMPTSWDWLSDDDQSALLQAMINALGPRSQNLLAPTGRFQDHTRLYKVRFFVRLKPHMPGCPPELIWSNYSEAFRIAAWHESSERTHPPVPLPDMTSAFVRNAKPNCSFQVPANLMNAMQGTSMSGLMNGAGGGGGGVGLGWICGFNIPLITICAFFVLNIFLSLLNIVFFWMPFIKICIPIPMPSSSSDSD
jgi:hypothetical protein